MAISRSSPTLVQIHENHHLSSNRSTSILHFPSCRSETLFVSALRTAATSDGGRAGSQDVYGAVTGCGPNLLKKPVVSLPSEGKEEEEEEEDEKDESELVDWEDLILEETVPLVRLVRMILHSGKYKSGERLSSEQQKTIMEKLLPYHPSYEAKIGCGIDYITVGYHPDFEDTRCLFIVRKDGEVVDFSYWKCIKGLIRNKYPLFAEGFILRHFRRRRFQFNRRNSVTTAK